MSSVASRLACSLLVLFVLAVGFPTAAQSVPLILQRNAGCPSPFTSGSITGVSQPNGITVLLQGLDGAGNPFTVTLVDWTPGSAAPLGMFRLIRNALALSTMDGSPVVQQIAFSHDDCGDTYDISSEFWQYYLSLYAPFPNQLAVKLPQFGVQFPLTELHAYHGGNGIQALQFMSNDSTGEYLELDSAAGLAELTLATATVIGDLRNWKYVYVIDKAATEFARDEYEDPTGGNARFQRSMKPR